MCDSVLRTQGCFNALKQPLPQGRHRPAKNDQDADDGQVGLNRRRQRRGAQAGQPRVLGLHGRIDGARPLRIGDEFWVEVRKKDVAARKVEADGRPCRTPQSMSFGPSAAVMITLPG